MTHTTCSFPKDVRQALDQILEHYWNDEQHDFRSHPPHERPLNHIYHSLRTIRRELKRSTTPPDVHVLLAQRKQVAIVWAVEDVLGVRPHLTVEQAWEVLRRCKRVHDCNYGFTWELLEAVADDLYPAEDSDEEERTK